MREPIKKRVQRTAETVGRRYLALITLGIGGAALASVGIMTHLVVLSAAGLFIALICLLGAIAWQQLNQRRILTAIRAQQRRQEALFNQQEALIKHQEALIKPLEGRQRTEHRRSFAEISRRQLIDHVATQRVLTEELHQAMGQLESSIDSRLNALLRSGVTEHGALIQLSAVQQPDRPGTVPDHIRPSQLLGLRNLLAHHRPRRILTFGLGAGAITLVDVVAECGGRLLAVETDEDPDKPMAATRLAQLVDDEVPPIVTVKPVAWALPSTVPALLPWYALTGLDDEAPFDVIAVAAPAAPHAQALFPLLPLISSHLAPGGRVILLEVLPDGPVGQVWAWEPGWAVTSHPNGISSFVPRT